MASHCNVPLWELEARSIQFFMVCSVSCPYDKFCKYYVVDDGGILDVQFGDFSYPPPDGFDRIMFEQNLL